MLYELRTIAQWMIGLFILSAIVKGAYSFFNIIVGDAGDAPLYKKQIKNTIIAIIVASICLTIISSFASIKPY